MGTKNNPGKFDCYENAEPDEPMFILLARDELAPEVVLYWTKLRSEQENPNPEKIDEAKACAFNMETWRLKQLWL